MYIFISEQIRTNIAAGVTLVLDRYYYSGCVYSAAKRAPGLDLAWARAPEAGLPRPDACVFLDVPAAAAQRRAGFGAERYETHELQRRVRALFFELARAEGDYARGGGDDGDSAVVKGGDDAAAGGGNGGGGGGDGPVVGGGDAAASRGGGGGGGVGGGGDGGGGDGGRFVVLDAARAPDVLAREVLALVLRQRQRLRAGELPAALQTVERVAGGGCGGGSDVGVC